MDLGKVRPGYHEGEEARLWTLPVVVFDALTGKQFNVVSIYVDEGYFCIDVEEKDKE